MAQALTAAEAAPWVERREPQQRHYATARTERLDVVADAVAHACRDSRRPVIADLGRGPGSPAAGRADRLPHARVLGVDHDPFLLALGQAVHGAAVTFVDARIGPGSWTPALSADGRLDAVVSTAALHDLPPADLATVYQQVHDLLRPGGVPVDADHLFQNDAPVRGLAAAVGRGHRARQAEQPAEDWADWWAVAAVHEGFAELLAERARRGTGPDGDNGLGAREYAELLCKAGFPAVGTVWQCGHSVVLTAVRGEEAGVERGRPGPGLSRPSAARPGRDCGAAPRTSGRRPPWSERACPE
ncbi:class I SAM-dependent methyltransferase [Streptomyces sp. CC208A]|uniref:class I SAM-dependent methyltransferase n=1 Tax=Streptomyces sp. CC208A TaxID=3044573 RepID=UPI0024A93F89|nr:class I SAM-dependent methyltransferase [Streptomyces sp. CC208A]